MNQNAFAARAVPQTRLGQLTALPRLPDTGTCLALFVEVFR